MPTLTTRLTPEGILLTNAYFDEITKTWISITPTAVYAGLFDEVFLAAGSITFTGAGNYLSGTSTVFNIGASGTAWTFETWVYPQASGAIFSIGDGTQYGQSFALDWGYTAADKFTIKQGDGTGYPISITTGSTYAANTWYHVAVSCTATGLRAIYINGIGDGGYMTSSPMSSSDNWVVNGFNDNNGIGNNGSTSYVSNLRIVVGTALYTSNFTPPYAALVPITNTQLLLCMSNNSGLLIDSSPNNFKVQVVGTPGASGFKPFTVNTVQRQLNTGTLQVSGYFDEETGII
jgi:hypothetical protein